MIPAVVRWLRQVLPPDWVVGSFLTAYLATVGPYLLMPEADQEMLRVRDGLVIVAATAWGAYRAGAMHPLFRPEYHRWLAATPWNRDKPLPLGPIHLVVQDALVLAVLVGSMHLPQFNRLLVPFMFLSGYLLTLALALGAAGRHWHAYALLFGLGWAVMNASAPTQAGMILTAVYLVGYAGLRRSLGDFPWEAAAKMAESIERLNKGSGVKELLGWPYDQLTPKPPEQFLPYRHGVTLSLLGGWWTCVATATVPRPFTVPVLGLIVFSTLILSVFSRLAIYCAHRRSPIGFWGRVFTLRWIVPSYDKVFVAPLCVPLALFMCAQSVRYFNLPTPYFFPLAEAAMLLVALNFGPRLLDWHFTGGYRIKPSMTGAGTRELIKL